MKILLATFLYDEKIGGGASVVVNQLANLLLRQNHDVSVLTTWSGNFIKTEFINEIKVIRLPASNIYWVGEKERQPVYKKVFWQLIDIWNPLMYRLVREVILDESPDILHSHKLRSLSPSIWSAASAVGIKNIVHTCHDFELLSPEGLLMGKVGRLAQEQRPVMRPYQHTRRHFSRLVHTATAPSQFVMDLHQKMGFFPGANIRIIPNTHGLSSEELQRNISESSKSAQNDLGMNFLFLGRLEKAKGIDVLCEAFSHADSKKHNLKLRLAGNGPLDEMLREKYKHQENMIFTGPVFGAQKDELFRNSNMLVAPSIVPESFGIVIAEAFSFGLPVIASRVGAYPEIVREGETGFLVEPGSVEELSSALIRICEKKGQISRMSKKCLVEANKYTSEKFLTDYLRIYTEMKNATSF
jgi:glycosyltransferase involved in cell wall biosynthesis